MQQLPIVPTLALACLVLLSFIATSTGKTFLPTPLYLSFLCLLALALTNLSLFTIYPSTTAQSKLGPYNVNINTTTLSGLSAGGKRINPLASVDLAIIKIF